jgi:hypothetical protein
MKKILIVPLKIIRNFFLILILVLLGFYLMAPVYEFSGPSKFSGDKFYNPYQNINPSQWRRYNFQVQSKAWGGLTSGRTNTNELIDSIYKQLHFDYVATSDYQKINRHGSKNENYIPTYEHGYNFFKTHQVCIDAKKVVWTDLLFFQTLSMKQWILDMLKQNSSLVAIAHPLLRNGYEIDEMAYLTNYDLMEVITNMRVSFDHWDAALSAGNPVWIIGDDDAHDVTNSNEVGRRFTIINSPTHKKDDIIASLKNGSAYGYDFFRHDDEDMEVKYHRIKHLPYLYSAKINDNTYNISLSDTAEKISFIGQDGKLLSELKSAKNAMYPIKKSDTYVRTVITFADSSSIYLNPIVRYSGEKLVSKLSAKVDAKATNFLRIIYFLIALTGVYLYLRRKQKKSGNNE